MRSIALCLLLIPQFGLAQNLVPNPSFEEYSECPNGTAGFATSVISWYSWQETPDYFNVCNNSLTGWVGVPENVWGFQYPISGEGYSALATYANYAADIREYIATPLEQPLILGQEYSVFFYASFYDGGVKDDYRCASNHIGVRFFKDPTFNSDDNPLVPDNIVHLDYPIVLVDSENWTLIEGSFVADDNYNWVAIGNFFDDDNTETQVINAPENCVAYYYIENICVASNPDDCSELLAISGQSFLQSNTVFPNPTVGNIEVVNYRHTCFSYYLHDGTGKLLDFGESCSLHTIIELAKEAEGLYQLLMKDENNNIQTIKILKQ